MSRLLDIARMPTTIDGIHESCMRSWHVLRWLLEAMHNEDASARFLADIADELMDAPFVHEQMTRKADDEANVP